MTSHFVNKISFEQEAVKKTKDEACRILKTMKKIEKNKFKEQSLLQDQKIKIRNNNVENADFSGRYHYL